MPRFVDKNSLHLLHKLRRIKGDNPDTHSTHQILIQVQRLPLQGVQYQ